MHVQYLLCQETGRGWGGGGLGDTKALREGGLIAALGCPADPICPLRACHLGYGSQVGQGQSALLLMVAV